MLKEKLKGLYPVKACEFEVNDGLVVVSYKNTKPSFIEKIFFKKIIAKPYKIDFDEIGSFIWLNCDGKINVNQLTNISKNHFGDKIEPAEERVEKFVEMLYKNKLITLYEKISKNT